MKGRLVGVALLSLCAPATFAAPCPQPTWSDADILRKTSFPGTPASKLWCGHFTRLPGRDLGPNDVCLGEAKRGTARIRAIEHAEIRGWFHGGPLTLLSMDEGEGHFTIEPDIGWTPNAPTCAAAPNDPACVTPFNTLQSLYSVLTPLDAGGSGQFHVEYSLWEPVRICNKTKDADQYRRTRQYCPEYQAYHPKEWCWTYDKTPDGDDSRDIYWPFDRDNPPQTQAAAAAGLRGPFKEGDYVRIVGTVWEDGGHKDDLKGLLSRPCEEQLGSRTSGRGWTEIHPVDFMARLAPPDGKTRAGIGVIAVCTDGMDTRDVSVSPARPKPQGHWRPAVTESISGDFTNAWSVTAKDIQRSSSSIRVTVGVQGRGLNERGMFFGGYSADWEACSPDCADKCKGDFDGCDGTCARSSQGCSVALQCPSTCQAGTRCCPGSGSCTPKAERCK